MSIYLLDRSETLKLALISEGGGPHDGQTRYIPLDQSGGMQVVDVDRAYLRCAHYTAMVKLHGADKDGAILAPFKKVIDTDWANLSSSMAKKEDDDLSHYAAPTQEFFRIMRAANGKKLPSEAMRELHADRVARGSRGGYYDFAEGIYNDILMHTRKDGWGVPHSPTCAFIFSSGKKACDCRSISINN